MLNRILFCSLLSTTMIYADCFVDTETQYDLNELTKGMSKVLINCIMSQSAQTAGCITLEKNIYTLQDNTFCVFNNGNNAIKVLKIPDPKKPQLVTKFETHDDGTILIKNGYLLEGPLSKK